MTDKLTENEALVHAALIATLRACKLNVPYQADEVKQIVRDALGMGEIRTALARTAAEIQVCSHTDWRPYVGKHVESSGFYCAKCGKDYSFADPQPPASKPAAEAGRPRLIDSTWNYDKPLQDRKNFENAEEERLYALAQERRATALEAEAHLRESQLRGEAVLLKSRAESAERERDQARVELEKATDVLDAIRSRLA